MTDPPTTERPNTQRLQAVVRGYVQGVGFRYFVVRRANELGLTGWAANERDGTVQVVAEGSPTALDELTRHLQAGPPGAHVEQVEVNRTPSIGDLRGFSIRSGGHSGD
ncbi:MAG TPA: acylphosphatase [Candidatus Limnocylindria bacterium]|nr:acylphosphatase [Candidatus Limnocylindria bacterium]